MNPRTLVFLIFCLLTSLGTGCSDRFQLLVVPDSGTHSEWGDPHRGPAGFGSDDTETTSDGRETSIASDDSENDTLFDECATVKDVAIVEKVPADIVIVVDNSISMEDEAAMVQDNMNHFSGQISVSGVDAHVVLISADSSDSEGICVAEPLGSGSCPDDSNPETNYLHVPRYIWSTTSLKRLHSTYDDEDYRWSHMLRENAILHFIVVSDDNSYWSKDDFIENMAELVPPIVEFTFHAIVASDNDITGSPCDGLSSREGTVYKELVTATGGVLGDLCMQEFQPVFDELAREVGEASMACSWKIPTPPAGEKFDTEKVNVDFTDGQQAGHHIGYVETADDCAQVIHGWYYDDQQNPGTILVCEQTCDWIQRQAKAEINIILGCETRDAQPVI